MAAAIGREIQRALAQSTRPEVERGGSDTEGVKSAASADQPDAGGSAANGTLQKAARKPCWQAGSGEVGGRGEAEGGAGPERQAAEGDGAAAELEDAAMEDSDAEDEAATLR